MDSEELCYLTLTCLVSESNQLHRTAPKEYVLGCFYLFIYNLILICMVLLDTYRGIFVAVVNRSEWQRGGLSLFGFVSLVCNNLWRNPEWSTCFLYTI